MEGGGLRRRIQRRVAVAITGTLVVAAAAGCFNATASPRPMRAVEVVGVVDEAYFKGDGVFVRLQDGRELTIPSRNTHLLARLWDRFPNSGMLLVGGLHPETWEIAAARTMPNEGMPDTCTFWLHSTGTDSGDFVDLDAGIRLEKAPGYANHGGGNRDHLAPVTTICLDRDGHVSHTFPDGGAQAFAFTRPLTYRRR